MRNSLLILLDIMENNVSQAEFAVLWTCHTTTVSDEEMPDGVVRLVANL